MWGRYQSGIYFQENEILLPQVLKDAGYSTAVFGKWHLGFGPRKGRGEEPDWNAELKPGPLECGFDDWFGMPNAHNMPPFVFVENHRVYKGDPADPIVMHSTEDAKAKKQAELAKKKTLAEKAKVEAAKKAATKAKAAAKKHAKSGKKR